MRPPQPSAHGRQEVGADREKRFRKLAASANASSPDDTRPDALDIAMKRTFLATPENGSRSSRSRSYTPRNHNHASSGSEASTSQVRGLCDAMRNNILQRAEAAETLPSDRNLFKEFKNRVMHQSSGQDSARGDLRRAVPICRFDAEKRVKRTSCAICLSPFKHGDLLHCMPCGASHFFHLQCAQQWLSGSTTCPLCRSDQRVHEALGEAPMSKHVLRSQKKP